MKFFQLLIPITLVPPVAFAAPISAAEAVANPVAASAASTKPVADLNANTHPEPEAKAEAESIPEADASREPVSNPVLRSIPGRDRNRMLFSRPRKHIPYDFYEDKGAVGNTDDPTPLPPLPEDGHYQNYRTYAFSHRPKRNGKA
ncbi:hypothetical protein MMC10_002893 [Thelotrema lepadinum]|nr:hypothetical protein [Thelotrema lepadinum]